MTLTETRPVQPQMDTGDHDVYAHYVFPASEVTRAMVTGEPCEALCGKLWVPHRDPTIYPMCPECKELAQRYFGT